MDYYMVRAWYRFIHKNERVFEQVSDMVLKTSEQNNVALNM